MGIRAFIPIPQKMSKIDLSQTLVSLSNTGRMRCDFNLQELFMSHHEDFRDSSSLMHLLLALVAMVSMPLLPMLMGWFTVLS